MTIPKPTARRRTDGAPPPVNRKRIKEKPNAEPLYAQKSDEKIIETCSTQETQVLTPKLLPITKKGVCPYCSQHIGKGIFGHMKSCQLTANSKIE